MAGWHAARQSGSPPIFASLLCVLCALLRLFLSYLINAGLAVPLPSGSVHRHESHHSANDPIGPRRTVYNSTSVMAICGPCRKPDGVFQKVPASQRLAPVSTVPDKTNTYSSAGW